jgi:CheY-like chemotaxis protein
LHVLVIDDEKYVADTLVMILEQSGLRAAAAYDGESALKTAETFLPTVVISDVIMPGMNGIEVCQAITARFPDCHIFLFSGQAATNDLVREAYAKGVSWELLAKPVEPDDLLARLAALPDNSGG